MDKEEFCSAYVAWFPEMKENTGSIKKNFLIFYSMYSLYSP